MSSSSSPSPSSSGSLQMPPLGVCETSLLLFDTQAHLLDHMWDRACQEAGSHYWLLSPASQGLRQALVRSAYDSRNGRLAAVHSGGLALVSEQEGVRLANGAWMRVRDPFETSQLEELNEAVLPFASSSSSSSRYYWVDVACLHPRTPLHAFLLRKADSAATSFSLYSLTESSAFPYPTPSSSFSLMDSLGLNRLGGLLGKWT